MLFNSLLFLFAFLPITYLIYWQLRTNRQRYVWLTITGYAFYSAWNYKFCALMALSTTVSYFAGLGMLQAKTAQQKKRFLVVPIVIDLLLLGFFKYWNFAAGSAAEVTGWLGYKFPESLLSWHIILPVGISFYTFHTISYIVDSYRGTITPTRNFFEFSCYVSLFCQLVAGPIVRFREVEKDLDNLSSADATRDWLKAASFFMIGMIKKVLIADTIAAEIDPAFAHYASLSTLDVWICVVGYTYQLYFDFSGYSDMAVGLGLMFGIRLPQNFNSPYKAIDISDFWRRWHISLSTVLRDYLYIPLGGNRGGEWGTKRNLMLTMLLGGLWHGANWTFVVWGGYHGLLLWLHSWFGDAWAKLPVAVRRAGTFFAVMIGWVFFRAPSMEAAGVLLKRMFIPATLFSPELGHYEILLAAIAICAAAGHFGPNTFELKHRWNQWQFLGLQAAMIVCVILILGGQKSPFLYFQF